jgi:quercetin dioxygenase-like cupin family protein
LNPLRKSRRSPDMSTPDCQSPESFALGTSAQALAIRRRLMERIADADESHLTIDGNEGDWQPFLDGVAIKVLRESAGVLSYLLRLDAGAVLSPHRHPHDEECVVLEGRLRVGSKIAIGPGGYHLAHSGALHATITTDTGATIFIRGAVPHVSQVLG